jgi:uncharacterized membrane protein YqaE (UPF0057 family)
MKYTKHLLIVSAVLILLSSCGSLSITQKRYSRGLNIDWFAGKDDTKPASKSTRKPSKVEVAAQPENNNLPSDNQQIALTPETSIEPAVIAVQESANPAESPKPTKVKIARSIKKLQSESVNQQVPEISKLSHVKQALKAAKKADSSVGTLILIILAILVPPLAVFLYYMELNAQFWLNILLVVLAVVLWPISNLLILAAVIHALMVVLGMLG